MKPHEDTKTLYKAKYSGIWHSKGDVKTRKKWNDWYMMEAKGHPDFVEVLEG